MTHLELNVLAVKEHPQKLMKDFGITYEIAIPSTVYDCWWFLNCKNVPKKLPQFLEKYTQGIEKLVGHGLSQEQATYLQKEEA